MSLSSDPFPLNTLKRQESDLTRAVDPVNLRIPCTSRVGLHRAARWRGSRLVLLLFITLCSCLADERLRLIIETDAGGDPDDEQSLVRFLLYTNEWDVEGIIANRPRTVRPENKNPEPTGLGVVRRLVEAYGKCYGNLVRHDARYPNPATLLARTVAGYDETNDAVKLIVSVVDRDDVRPVWYADWGSNKG